MPRKNPHTSAEVAALADRLRASRPDGMSVEAWLVQKHAELRSMTRGTRSWSWDEIAAALNMAGITYRAGVTRTDGGTSRGRWTTLQLQNKVRAIRERELARRPSASASDADAMAAVIEALVRRGVLAAPHGAGAGSSDPGTRRNAIQQLAAPPPPSPPQPSIAENRDIPRAAFSEPGHQGPLAQAVADQAARDDRVLAKIRERRRQQATGTSGSDQE